MGSPTTRTLELLRKQGYTAQVVERWQPHSRRRIDLFGVIDVLAIDGTKTIGVQTTSASNTSARRQKIYAEPAAAKWLASGNRLFIHGWRKKRHKPGGKAMRWVVNEEEVLLSDFPREAT
jgi:hypothetical protein